MAEASQTEILDILRARLTRVRLRADLFRTVLGSLVSGAARHDRGFISARVDLAWQYVDASYPLDPDPESAD